MNKAVIYARYSSDRQTEQSIEGQVHVCQKYAETHDITIVDQYIDRAMTGTNDNRAAFQKMISDSKRKQWDIVLVYKLDRFSRDTYESAIHKHTLKENGVKLVSAMENIPEGPEGIILESLLNGMNQYYSAELSQKVKRGLKESWSKGQFTGGTPVFGYRIIDKKYVVQPHEADIVRSIFYRYTKGETLPQIVNDLNKKGERTQMGKKFTKNGVWNLLYNTKYIGLVKHGDKVYDNITPPIVPIKLWNEVQEMKTAQNRNSNWKRNHSKYLLAGRVLCGECGNKLIGVGGTSKTGKVFYYYKCRTKVINKDKETCKSKPINKELLENCVVNAVYSILSDEKTILHIANKVYEKYKETTKDTYSYDNLMQQYNTTKKALFNIGQAIEQGIINDYTKNRMDELQFELSNIEFALGKAEMDKSEILTIDKIIDYLKNMNMYKTDTNNTHTLLIRTFLNKVIVYQNKIDIYLNYSNTNLDSSLCPCIEITDKKVVVIE